jgi:hypothetical protein
MVEELKKFLLFTWAYSIKFSKPAATRVLTLSQLSHNSAYNLDATFVYVYSRGGPHTALAPRPSLIYCALDAVLSNTELKLGHAVA